MRRLAIFLCIIFTCVWASTTAGAFLQNAPSVQSLARGGIALDHSTAGFVKNPAILLNTQQSAYISQGALMDDVQYMSLAYTQPRVYQDWAVGVSLIHTGLTGIQETSYDAQTGSAAYTGKTFGYAAQGYILGIATPVFNTVQLGANLKIIQEKLFTDSSAGFGLDLGATTQWDKITLGVTAINALQPKLHWTTGATYAMDRSIILSTLYAYSPELSVFFDTQKGEALPLQYSLGAEYVLFSHVSIRGSYGTQLALGTGLNYGDLNMDYAYVDNEKNLGKTQYVSLAYQFGTPQLNPSVTIEEPAPVVKEPAREVTKDIILSIPTTTAETAEIKPLPLPEPQAIIAEKTTAAIVETTVEPIIDTTTEKLVTVSLPEAPVTPVHEYQIAVVSPRYYTTGKLITKAFVDNTGNQTDIISANMTLSELNGKTLNTWTEATANVSAKETHVFYFNYEKPMVSGNYGIEIITKTNTVTRYEKGIFKVH